jgi:rod shape-determining protein MreC
MFTRLKRKKILLLVLVTAGGLAVFSFTRSSSELLAFPAQFLQAGLASAHGAFTRIQKKIFEGDAEETLRLREENAKLRSQLIALEEEKKTWELWQQVRSDLFADLPRGTAARVIAGDPSVQRRSLILDKGSNDGLHQGQTVLAQGGLVGRLVQVSAQTSQVLLLTDPFSVVDVLDQTRRARGTLKGARDGLSLGGEYFLARDPLQAGDLLLTSGQDGMFPKGIPVGVVRQLQKDESGVFYRASVEPVVQFKRLEIVEVI